MLVAGLPVSCERPRRKDDFVPDGLDSLLGENTICFDMETASEKPLACSLIRYLCQMASTFSPGNKLNDRAQAGMAVALMHLPVHFLKENSLHGRKISSQLICGQELVDLLGSAG